MSIRILIKSKCKTSMIEIVETGDGISYTWSREGVLNYQTLTEKS